MPNSANPLAICARCGHQAREHRPTCVHCDSAGRFCRCVAFKAPAAKAAANHPNLNELPDRAKVGESAFALAMCERPSTYTPNPDQLEMVIPGADEADEDAERNRARIERELAGKQTTERAQRAFNQPNGPLFNMFNQQPRYMDQESMDDYDREDA